MKKIMCLLLLVAMLMSVSANAEDISADDVSENTVEDVIDSEPEDVIDSEPEDTPDEAPADIAEEPVEVEEQEPEDTPDASPDDDDDIPVATLAEVTEGYAGPTELEWFKIVPKGNVYYEYDSETKTLRFYIGEQQGDGSLNYTIGRTFASEWESLDVSKVVIEEGITTINLGAFNNMSGDIVFELPKSITDIHAGAFGTWINGWVGKDALHAIINYKGTEDEWNNITIGSDNDGLALTSTWYFQVYIPDEINLTNTNPEEEFTTYRASSTCSVKAGVYFGELIGSNTYDYDEETMTSYADIGTCSEEQNIVTGFGNTVYFFAEHQCHINDDGTQYGTCTVGIKQTEDGVYMYEPDYQDYTASQKLTFEFVID